MNIKPATSELLSLVLTAAFTSYLLFLVTA
jgi:hypothetical protein